MIFSSIFRTISQKIYTNPIPLLLIFLKLYSHLQCDFIYIVFQRQRHPTPVLLPGKSHGRKSMVGCSPWGRWGSDTTERLHFHALKKEMATHSSVLAWRIPGTGEPGGLPSIGLQSRTQLKRLSSSLHITKNHRIYFVLLFLIYLLSLFCFFKLKFLLSA